MSKRAGTTAWSIPRSSTAKRAIVDEDADDDPASRPLQHQRRQVDRHGNAGVAQRPRARRRDSRPGGPPWRPGIRPELDAIPMPRAGVKAASEDEPPPDQPLRDDERAAATPPARPRRPAAPASAPPPPARAQGLTAWVRGRNHATVCAQAGRLSSGKNTPEKNNIIEMPSVK